MGGNVLLKNAVSSKKKKVNFLEYDFQLFVCNEPWMHLTLCLCCRHEPSLPRLSEPSAPVNDGVTR